MGSKIKKIIIIVIIFVLIIAIYFIFFKKEKKLPSLTSNINLTPASIESGGSRSEAGREFLTTLLSLKQLRLDETLFANPAFSNLHDFSIILIPEGNEGRPNPFAPLGVDISNSPILSPAPSLLSPTPSATQSEEDNIGSSNNLDDTNLLLNND